MFALIGSRQILLLIILVNTLICFIQVNVRAESFNSKININFTKMRNINSLLFGHNTLGYDPCTYEKNADCVNRGGYSNHAAGQWNPSKKVPESTLLQLGQEINTTMLRFPGGCGTHNYNWKKTIGPIQERYMLQFGLDEFLSLCAAIGAKPIITMSYFTGTNDDLADMVEYLNYPIGAGNPNGGVNWAEERGKNGHPEPYHVRYFEYGNEVYHGNHRDIKKVDPGTYARDYLSAREKFRQIDPNIQLGVVMQGWKPGMTLWDRRIAEICLTQMDFVINHIYQVGYRSNDGVAQPDQLFVSVFEKLDDVKKGLEKFSAQLKKYTLGNVPIAITEYNGDFLQDRPVPYRHCLGNALYNAAQLQTFLYTNAPILCANYWQFSNSYWGLVYNKEYMEGTGTYVKRPNFHIFEMFAKHFGKVLLETVINHDQPIASAQNWRLESKPNQIGNKELPTSHPKQPILSYPSTQYLSVAASTDQNKKKLYLMVINKHMQQSSQSTITINRTSFSGSGMYWVLNGPRVDSTNEGGSVTVNVTSGEFTLKNQAQTFNFIFEPHSMTVIEIPFTKKYSQ